VRGIFIPAAGDHGLWPWRNVQSCDRNVAPHGREVGDHGLCPWGSMPHLRSYISKREKYDKENVGRWLMAVFRSLTKKKVIFILIQKYKGGET